MHAVRQMVCVVVIASGLLFSGAVSQATAGTPEQYYRDVIKQSTTVVIASYVKSAKGIDLRIKYGWGGEFYSIEGVYGSGFIDTSEDQMIFIVSKDRYNFAIVDQIPYSQAQVAYKLLGDPEWGVTPDGSIAYYSDEPKK